jgi:hypothetical protein
MELPFEINPRGKLVDKTDYQGLIAKYISTAAGRAALAASMVQPLRRRLDYQGIARKVFSVEPLPQGALPTYERDIDVSAVVTAENKVFGERITIPQFEVYQNPTINISEVKRRRFNLIDRTKKRLTINRQGKLVEYY